jgi:catechol 2,3-dioxygenase-like lactoylglutathione lyase family enzyme
MNLRTLVTMLLLAAVAAGPTFGQERGAAENQDSELPSVTALVPNFYYHDLATAREWYVDKLGFTPIYEGGWVVIVEVAPGMQIALVDGERGTLKPVEDKGALLVIETDELEEWYRYVSRLEGIEWYQYGNESGRYRLKHGIMEHEEIEEFRIVDPGGYIIEFYRWKPAYRP